MFQRIRIRLELWIRIREVNKLLIQPDTDPPGIFVVIEQQIM
jgi:hypothetical protein